MRADPAAGDVADVLLLARTRRSLVDAVDGAYRRLTSAVRGATPASWEGAARDAFVAAGDALAPGLIAVADVLDAHAEALGAYAGALEDLRDRAADLRRRLVEAEHDLERARGALLGPALTADVPVPWSPVGAAPADPATTLVAAAHRLEGLEADWQGLLDERRRVDDRCAAALAVGPDAGGSSSGGWLDRPQTGEHVLEVLSGLPPLEAAAWAALHPEAADLLERVPPAVVAAWWRSLDDASGQASPSATQLLLLAGAPGLLGALDGLPPGARVRANAVAAGRRLERLTARLRRLEGEDDAVWSAVRDELELERDYLRRVVGADPEVQLYVYDPAHHRIVEMIGSAGPAPSHVITYVPGTFSDLEGFWSGDTQQVARRLVGEAPIGESAVAFVWKDGVFPAEKSPVNRDEMAYFMEANDEPRAEPVGIDLARFRAGLDAHLPASTYSALGHSWGTAAVTSAEVHGAHWDHVLSLSGAGVPEGWQRAEGTTYRDFSYFDGLQVAQKLRQVWHGRNPRAGDRFDHGDYYAPPSGVPDLLGDHELIAQDAPENDEALADMRKEIYG